MAASCAASLRIMLIGQVPGPAAAAALMKFIITIAASTVGLKKPSRWSLVNGRPRRSNRRLKRRPLAQNTSSAGASAIQGMPGTSRFRRRADRGRARRRCRPAAGSSWTAPKARRRRAASPARAKRGGGPGAVRRVAAMRAVRADPRSLGNPTAGRKRPPARLAARGQRDRRGSADYGAMTFSSRARCRRTRAGGGSRVGAVPAAARCLGRRAAGCAQRLGHLRPMKCMTISTSQNTSRGWSAAGPGDRSAPNRPGCWRRTEGRAGLPDEGAVAGTAGGRATASIQICTILNAATRTMLQ